MKIVLTFVIHLIHLYRQSLINNKIPYNIIDMYYFAIQ
jgi:hypothetical protein